MPKIYMNRSMEKLSVHKEELHLKGGIEDQHSENLLEESPSSHDQWDARSSFWEAKTSGD